MTRGGLECLALRRGRGVSTMGLKPLAGGLAEPCPRSAGRWALHDAKLDEVDGSKGVGPRR